MTQQSYNFFGQAPGQMVPGQDPATLAQQMALQQFNNPTSSQAQGTGSKPPSIDPKELAAMMNAMQQTPTQDSMGVGSGLTPQFAAGLGGSPSLDTSGMNSFQNAPSLPPSYLQSPNINMFGLGGNDNAGWY